MVDLVSLPRVLVMMWMRVFVEITTPVERPGGEDRASYTELLDRAELL
jgi:hypothetical protein